MAKHKYRVLTEDERAMRQGVPYKLVCRKCGLMQTGIPQRLGCKPKEKFNEA